MGVEGGGVKWSLSVGGEGGRMYRTAKHRGERKRDFFIKVVGGARMSFLLLFIRGREGKGT